VKQRVVCALFQIPQKNISGFSQRTKNGGDYIEKNIPAEKASAQNGARLPQKNVYGQRPQGACSPQGEGQKAAFRLSPAL
jgi:hypothetical protein